MAWQQDQQLLPGLRSHPRPHDASRPTQKRHPPKALLTNHHEDGRVGQGQRSLEKSRMIGLIIQQSSLYKSSFKQQCQRTDQKTAEREFNLNGYLTLIFHKFKSQHVHVTLGH